MTPPKDRAELVRMLADMLWARAVPDGPANATDDVKAVLALIEAAGCRVVPVKATKEMCEAGESGHSHETDFDADFYGIWEAAWRGYLAASPFAPEGMADE